MHQIKFLFTTLLPSFDGVIHLHLLPHDFAVATNRLSGEDIPVPPIWDFGPLTIGIWMEIAVS